MRWGFVICGLLILLVEAFFDNVRGPLIPVFTQVLNIDYGRASLLVVLGALSAVVFTLLLIPLLSRYSLRNVSLAICGLAIFTSVFGFLVQGFITFLLFSVLVGAVVAMMGVLCNVLVLEGTDLHHRSRSMCILHMMYGFGSLLAPMTVRIFLERGLRWQWVLVAFIPVTLITAGLLKQQLPANKKEKVPISSSGRLTPVQLMIMFTFSIYVAAEVMSSMWMVTYLVETQHFTVAQAAPYLSGFFLTMALSRGFCFFSLKPSLESFVLALSLVLALVFFFLGRAGYLWAFPLVGLLGPYFPLYLSRISRSFPEEAHRLTIWILGSVQMMLVVFHLFVGKVTDRLGIAAAYWLPPILLVAALCLLGLFLQAERRRLRKSQSRAISLG